VSRRLLRSFLAALVAAPLLVLIGPVSPASAWPTPNVDLLGHGFGHGRGLGQYGSLGYAIDHGWDHRQILNHYYGGTREGNLNGNPNLLVQLTRLDGKDTIVQQEKGQMISNHVGGTHRALRAVRIGPDLFRIDGAADCGGGPAGWQTLNPGVRGPVIFAPNPATFTNAREDNIQVCEPNANRWYRGQIEVFEHDGRQITTNNVLMEDYLKGVVPRESPASWADLGGGKGINALRAQSVAARSYAWAEDRAGPAKTCDTIACQVYLGRAEQVSGAAFKELEDVRSSRAIDETAGQIRISNATNAVSRTEFSSSTGGYTAGGQFPAVVDEGDRTASNPNHTWRTSIPVANIEGRYNRGSLQQVSILQRNGLGAEGGRVVRMRLTFSGGSVDLTGNEFRVAFSLKSDWFSVTGEQLVANMPYHVLTQDGRVWSFGGAVWHGGLAESGGRGPAKDLAEGPGGGYWILTGDGSIAARNVPHHGSTVGMRVNTGVIGMAASATGRGYWVVAGDGGIFTFGDAPFHGSTGAMRLNAPIIAMAPTSSGNGYWLVGGDGGIFTFGDAPFHGSTGAMRLNQPVFAMAPTNGNGGYWLVARDGGIFTFGNAPYLGSLPERGIRETAVELVPMEDGSGYLIVTAEGRVHAFGGASSGGGPRDAGAGNVATVAAGRPRG
jgi:SpoIID/LytB domain protein